ncbi:MAG: hypothetical protein RL266_682 [Bacteroidota bacterium]|jgi:hypothetical protein
MKKTLLILLSVINQLFMATLSVAQISSGSISGWVHDEISSLPIPFAQVDLLAEGKLIKSAVADSIGKFSIPIDKTQLLALRVSADSHHSQERNMILAVGVHAEAYFALKSSIESGQKERFIGCRGPGVCITTVAGVQDCLGDVGSITQCRRNSSTDTYIDGVRIVGSSSLEGTISDSETGEPLPFATVVLSQNGKQLCGTTTDFDGVYRFNSLLPGDYDLKASFVGYTAEEFRNVLVKPDKARSLHVQLEHGIFLCEVIIEESYPLLIEKSCGGRCTFSCCYCGGCKAVETVLLKNSSDVLEPEIGENHKSISLYPNPASSQITIDLWDLKEEPLSLRILDSSGRIVLEQKPVQLSRLSIPLDGLSDGVYFASVQLKDKLLTERFIVAK